MQTEDEDRTADLSTTLRYAPDFHFIGNKLRVPHISLVFREMWDTTALNPQAFGSRSTLKV
jgi:hypothetical protein